MDDIDTMPVDQLRAEQQRLQAEQQAAAAVAPPPSNDEIDGMDYGQLKAAQQQLQQQKLAPHIQQAQQAEAQAERSAPWSRQRLMEPGIQHSYLMRKAFAVSQPIHDYEYGRALSRLNRGEDTEDDLKLIAHRQLQDSLDAQQSQGRKLAGGVMGIPGQVAEIMAGGRLAGAVGAGATEMAGGAEAAAQVPAALRLVGSSAAQAAVTPSLGPQAIIHQNLEAGRDPLDMRGVAPGMARATMEAVVLQKAGKAWGALADKLPGQAGRVAQQVMKAGAGYPAAALTGPINQQITDLTTYTLGLNTRYGVAQEIAEGKYGEAASAGLLQMLTFAALHESHGGDGKAVVKEYTDTLHDLGEKGVPPTEAFKQAGELIDQFRRTEGRDRRDMGILLEQRRLAREQQGKQPPVTGPPEAVTGPQPPVTEPAPDTAVLANRFPDLSAEEIQGAMASSGEAANAGFQKWASESERLLRAGRPISDREMQRAQQLASIYVWAAQKPAPDTARLAAEVQGAAQQPPEQPQAAPGATIAPEPPVAPPEPKVAPAGQPVSKPEPLEGKWERQASYTAGNTGRGRLAPRYEAIFGEPPPANWTKLDIARAIVGHEAGARTPEQVAADNARDEARQARAFAADPLAAANDLLAPPEPPPPEAPLPKATDDLTAEIERFKKATTPVSSPEHAAVLTDLFDAPTREQAELERTIRERTTSPDAQPGDEASIRRGFAEGLQRAAADAEALAASQRTPPGPAAPPAGPAQAPDAVPKPAAPATAPAGGGAAGGDKLTEHDLADRLLNGQPVPGLTAVHLNDLRKHVLDGRTLESIGAERGVSREAVRRSIERALEKLAPLTEEPPPPTVAEGGEERVVAPGELRPADEYMVEDPYVTAIDALSDQMMKEVADADGNLPRARERWYEREFDALGQEQVRSTGKGPALARAAARRREAQAAEKPAAPARPAAAHAEPAGGDTGFDINELIDPAHPADDSAGRGGERPAVAEPPRTEPAAPASAPAADPLAKRVVDFMKGEAGFGVPGMGVAYVAERVRDALARNYWMIDEVKKFGQKTFPALTRENRLSGEAAGRYISSRQWGEMLAPALMDKIFGEKPVTEADRRLVGTVMDEMHLRHTKQAYLDKADELAQKARTVKNVAAAAEIRNAELEAREIARNVKTMIGAGNSPLKTEAEYQAALGSKLVTDAIDGWKTHVVPVLNDLFNRGRGMASTDPIDSFTQIPDLPMNLMALKGAVVPAFPGSGRGNIRNTEARKSVFANQRKGNSEAGYETDLALILKNSLGRQADLAAKREMFDVMAKQGIGERGAPGQAAEGHREIPNVFKGSKEPSFYVPESAYGDVRDALNVDRGWKGIPGLTPALNWAALRSSLEAAYHSRNLLSAMMAGPMRFADLYRNSRDYIKGTPEVRDRLIELARIGALKPHGYEGQAPDTGSKLNPLKWGGKLLDAMNDVVRLTASNAFDRATGQQPDLLYAAIEKMTGWRPKAENTETNRRDFINQLTGQYNKRAQTALQVMLRDTGFGPFTTAASMTYMRGLRQMTGHSGLTADSVGSNLGFRVEAFAKMAAVLGVVAATNYLLHGRADGDDQTPFGAVKLGESDGKTVSLDLADIAGMKKGARAVGAMAMIEGERESRPPGRKVDRAMWDAASSAFQPLLGPTPDFLHTAFTGKDMLGRKVAPTVGPDESQTAADTWAAARQSNALLHAATAGADNPKAAAPPTGERAVGLLGPFGAKFRGPLTNFHTQYQDAKDLHAAALANRQPLPPAQARRYAILSAFHERIQALDKAVQTPGLPEATKTQLREHQQKMARLAVEAAGK